MAAFVLGAWAASAAPSSQPPAPPSQPVAETLYGQTVVDPYRSMEALGPDTVAWIKAEGRYTRRVFDSMPGRAALGRAMAAFTASIVPIDNVQVFGGRTFYEAQPSGSDNRMLMERRPDGRTVALVDVAALRAAHGGEPYAIDYYAASPDGTKVAVGVSRGGGEDAALEIYDAETGRRIAGPLPRARFALSWAGDSRGVFVTRRQQTGDVLAKYLNSHVEYWDFQHDPVPLIGAGLPDGMQMQPADLPAVHGAPGSAWVRAVVHNGVQNERQFWIARAADAVHPGAPWRKLVDFSDGVTASDQSGDDLYFISHEDAPTFKMLHLKAGRPFSEADTLLPADPGRVVDGFAAASDGLYVDVREGLYSHLLRIAGPGAKPEEITLPVKGSLQSMFTDPRRPGVIVQNAGWVTPDRYYRYDPATGRMTDLDIGPPRSFDASRFVVQELQARARDGVDVPLSYMAPKDFKRPGPVVLFVYGAYGDAEFPYFSATRSFFLRQGVGWAVCHARGGGELGEAWRLGGKDETKPNTWRDLIACAESLIARGDATPKTLFILGGSAGGVAIGRAMEERPDLFAGAIDAVPEANTLRAEFSTNGPANIPEFGTVKTERGFQSLYAMDSYQHVETGVRYPPVLITTGLNDARVPPWEPAKLAARMLSAGDLSPVLLRVDEEGGHGIQATKAQNDALYADILSFVFWRIGRPDFQPRP